MNTYKDSWGNKWTTDQINRKSDFVAKTLLESQIIFDGYNYCQQCKRSDLRLDVAHIVSRKKAKEMGTSELCWDMDNMKILCRKCHQNLDKLNLQFEADKEI